MSVLKKVVAGFFAVSFMSTASAAMITFDASNVSDYGNPSQSINGTTVVSPDGSMIELDGNTWSSHSISPITVNADTVLTFDFSSSNLGEINGIGLDNDNLLSPMTTFQLGGSQMFGIQAFNTVDMVNTNYTFSINVSDFFVGTFDRLVFIADSDAASTSTNSKFSNLSIGAVEVNAPATLALILLGCVVAFSRKRS